MLKKAATITAEQALPGRETEIVVPEKHFVSGRPLKPPFPDNTARILFGMGCFWGAERRMWEQPGVYTTAVGYTAGFTQNPTYEEVCTGMTGHTEAVLVVYEDSREALDHLLKVFWESHDPTQGMRQGNDIGTQYRSGIYVFNSLQKEAAEHSRTVYQQSLDEKGLGKISTEIIENATLFYAEDYHQQYLAKNPNGYCGLGGKGVCFME